MPTPRVAIVIRRFWPLVGGPERIVASLASEFAQREVATTIVTAQWEPHWPQELPLFDARVVRLPHPQVPGWGLLRYLWSLGSWLRTHRHEFDAVIVSGLRYEAYVAQLSLSSSPIPVILRAEKGGVEGDIAWQNTQRLGQRVRQSCLLADCVIAPQESIAEELLQAGYANEQLEMVSNGVAHVPERTAETRLAARQVLGETHHDLQADANTLVAIYVGRLTASAGLHDLIRAWRKVVEIWPDARLWMIGEGPGRYDLYERIRESHLQYHVIMPGAFDEVAELLPAADVCVYPTHHEYAEQAILEALAAGVPVIATEQEGNKRLFEPELHGLNVPVKNPTSLAEAIARIFTMKQEAADRASKAQAWAREAYSASQMAEQHLAIVDRLITSKRARINLHP
jgi:glycosyltransferase involved in cell wall biosynthesis